MIPGANLLNMALTVIGRQRFEYLAFLSRKPNNVGQDITTYKPPVCLTGSVQPVPRSYYQLYGLDFQRNYQTFFVSKNALDVARDISGDHMIFNRKTYQCVSRTDWFAVDGWESILCVEVTYAR